jgi:lipoprotein signal peptidase
MATYDAGAATGKRVLRLAAAVAVLGVLSDQASKSWASVEATEPRPLVPGYVAAYSVQNAGSFLGLGGDQAHTSTISALLGIACATLLVRTAYADRGRWQGADWQAAALLLAGIFGNTLDRLALGHVRDFLVTWALPTFAFNVADLFVVVGAASLMTARCCRFRLSRSDHRLTNRAAA